MPFHSCTMHAASALSLDARSATEIIDAIRTSTGHRVRPSGSGDGPVTAVAGGGGGVVGAAPVAWLKYR